MRKSLKPFASSFKAAFTLIELLVVIAIVGLLMALAAPVVGRSIQASRLTAAGEGLANRLSQAQQLALSGGQRIEVRFYKYSRKDEPPGSPAAVRAYQFYRISDNTADAAAPVTPLSEPYMIESGTLIAGSSELSPLVSGTDFKDEPRTFPAAVATYYALQFMPDGTMKKVSQALPAGSGAIPPPTLEDPTLSQSYVTFIFDTGEAAPTEVPANYFTVQIDPYTGRAKSFRPRIL